MLSVEFGVIVRCGNAVRVLAVAAAAAMVVGCGDGEDRSSEVDHSSLSSDSTYDSSSSDDSSSSAGSSGSSYTSSTGSFADDMRALMPNLEVDDEGLTDIGEGICVWYDDGVSYPKAIESMEFMGADEALGATVIASAVEHLCPLAWPAQHRNASNSSSSSSSRGTSALAPDVEPAEPKPVAEVAAPAPAQSYVPPPPPPEPTPNLPCPRAENIEVTAALIGMTPFSDTAHGVTLTGWKYKVRTTVRNTAAVSATVVTSVAVNGPHGMIDSSVESVEVAAKGHQSVTSFEMISYDDKPVGLQVRATNELGQITSMEPCQA